MSICEKGSYIVYVKWTNFIGHLMCVKKNTSWKWLRDILYFHLLTCPKSFVFWSVVLLELEVEDTMDSPIESHLTTLGLKADEKISTQEVVKAYKYTKFS